jgi:TolB-like protein/Tfp pilus assembly protein PilF
MHFSQDQIGLLNEAVEKSRIALALDNRDPVCHLADARVHSFLGQNERAIAEARDAVSLNPTSAMCHHALGFVLGRAGKVEEAIPSLERAVELGPRDVFLPGYLTFGSAMFYFFGRYEEALAWARRASSSSNPRSHSFHFVVAALIRLGRHDEAKSALSELLSRSKGSKTLEDSRKSLSVNLPGTPEGNQDTINALREAGLPESEPHSHADRPSIAVLPFDNLSKDREQEVLSDGIADDIINGLSKFRSLFVIARRSTFTYKEQNKDISNIADELGVRYVVEGSVRRSGERIRVTAQLIDTESSRHIWSDRFDRTLEDVFAVQDEVSEAIIHEIAPEIGQAEIARARRTPPGSLDAWSIYQRGLSLYPSGAAEDFDAATELFDQAHAMDPNFVDALAMAAYMRLRKVFYFGDTEGDMLLTKARELLSRSMRLDSSNSIAHLAMGRIHTLCDEPGLAEQTCRKAVELNPNSVLAHVEMAAALTVQARYEEALLEWDTVESLSPTDPHMAAVHAGRSRSLFGLGWYEECVEQARAASNSANPRYWADAHLVAALTILDRPLEAEAAKQVLLKRKPDFTLATLGQTHGLESGPMSDALLRAGIPEVSQSLQPPDRPSIAVLPFDNLSADPEQEYLADGMAEDIIAGISKFHWLFVIARNSSFAYKGKSPDVRDVARDLGVRYVLEGSVRRGGTRIRIAAQLVDAESGSHIWAERYDRELTEIFAVQDEVTAAIVATIAPEIGQSEIERAKRRPPESLDAWALFQQGMALYPSGASKDFQTAIALFDRARYLDPGFVEALVMAGHMRTRFVNFFGMDDRDRLLAEARDLLQEAMRIDPSNATCHMAMGRWYVAQNDSEAGLEHCREAVALNPNSVLAHFELGIALNAAARYEEALSHYDTARRLSPRDLHAAALSTGPTFALFMLGRFEEAATNAARVSRSPNPRYWADALLVAALTKLDRRTEAEAAKEVLLTRRPDFTIREFKLAPSSILRSDEIISALREAGLPE